MTIDNFESEQNTRDYLIQFPCFIDEEAEACRNDPHGFPRVETPTPSPPCLVLAYRNLHHGASELGETDYSFDPFLIFLKTHKISLEHFLIFLKSRKS